MSLRPELFFARFFHLALTFRTGVLIPYPDVIATAVQAQTTYLTSVRWSHIGNNATDDDVLDGLAIRARHGRNFLTKETTAFIYLGFVATCLTVIFQFPCHFCKYCAEDSYSAVMDRLPILRSSP